MGHQNELKFGIKSVHVFGAVLGWHFLGKVAQLSQKGAHFGYPWHTHGVAEKPLFAHGLPKLLKGSAQGQKQP